MMLIIMMHWNLPTNCMKAPADSEILALFFHLNSKKKEQMFGVSDAEEKDEEKMKEVV